MLSIKEARAAAERLVQRALEVGAESADALCAASRSRSVQARLGALEDASSSEGMEIGLRLFVGSRSASGVSSDLSEPALEELVSRVLAMAKAAPEDRFAGLAPADLLARPPFPELDCADPAKPDLAELRRRALDAESTALGVAEVTNSSGASASASASVVALATSAGFSGAYRTTGFSCAVGVIAGEGRAMQHDHGWHSARHFADLEAPEAIGRLAGERAAARLNPAKLESGVMPVLFDPRVSYSLLGHLASAISGSVVACKASFLQDRLGERIFPEGVDIIDDPLRSRGLRSRPFDGEGLAVGRTEIVAGGMLRSWMAESASARQLGIDPTGHAARSAGGSPGVSPSNFYMAAGTRSREQLLSAYPRALLVTQLIGQGVNRVTGDYSRGAAGFLVEGGAIGPPVEEITIASNLIDMFEALEPGSDLEFRRGIDAPTILIPEMTVASA